MCFLAPSFPLFFFFPLFKENKKYKAHMEIRNTCNDRTVGLCLSVVLAVSLMLKSEPCFHDFFKKCANTLLFNVITAAAAESLQSCPTLCDPIDGRPQGSPVHGIFQARVLEWGAIAFSKYHNIGFYFINSFKCSWKFSP